MGTAVLITFVEDTVHVKPVGGTRLVVGASLEVVTELPGTGIINHPRVRSTDFVCGEKGIPEKIIPRSLILNF